jgi:hypothetical protein
MCRWLAYSGTPIWLEELVLRRDRSRIDRSLHSRAGATTTTGAWNDVPESPVGIIQPSAHEFRPFTPAH